LTKIETDTARVRDFFDRIAPVYSDKYSGRDAFLHYFFNERLHEATRGFEFQDKSILDVGAGTGSLYDHLKKKAVNFEYFATDISAEMLNQSAIPRDRRFVGHLEEIEFATQEFDFVFILGVSTYLNDSSLSNLLRKVTSMMSSGSRVIMSCTHRNSLDWRLRRLFKMFPSVIKPKNFVLSQDFTIYPRTVDDLAQELPEDISIEEVRWLNHTVFPFNQILKSTSVRLARRIHRIETNGLIKTLASSDFLVVLAKADNVSRRRWQDSDAP
jgi:SAM-dependent methyltransferase